MEYAVNKKDIEVSEKILLCAFNNEMIDTKLIKHYCSNGNVGIDQVCNALKPYLDVDEGQSSPGINIRYRINKEGSKFIISGLYERERLKRRIDILTEQDMNLQADKMQCDKKIRKWQLMSLAFGVIASSLSVLGFILGTLLGNKHI